MLDFLVAQNLVGVALYDEAQMRGNDGARIYDGVAECLRLVACTGLDPDRIHTERRILGGNTLNRTKHPARVDGQLAIRIDDALAHRYAAQVDAINIGSEVEVVSNMNRGYQEAEVLRELAPYTAHAGEQ